MRTSTLAAVLGAAALAALVWVFADSGRERGSAASNGIREVAPEPAGPAPEERAPAALSAPVRAPAADEAPAPSESPAEVPAAAPEEAPDERPGRIFGHVYGPDGQLVAGRDVRVLRTPGGPVTNVKSAPDGSFEATALPPGKYHVSSQPSDEELTALGLRSKVNGLEWLAQESVVLAPRAEIGIELGAPPAKPIRVTGALIGREPAPDALLQWVPEGAEGYNRARYVSTRDGRYEIVLAEPGRYRLSAVVQPSSLRVDHAVDVPDAPGFRYDVAVPPGRLLVSVATAGGAPVAGASIDLVPRAGIAPLPCMSSNSFTKRTRADGTAELDGLSPGTWLVTVHGAKQDESTPLAAQHRLVEIESSRSPRELEILLSPGIVATGRVVTAEGAPVYAADVHVFDEAGEPLTPLQGARSGKDGAFTLTALRPGAYFATAAKGDAWSAPARLSLAAEGGAAPLELTVAPTARLAVDHSRLARPAWIDVRDEHGNCFSALLDRNMFSGAYGRDSSTVSASYYLPPGNYEVRALGKDGVLASQRLALLRGEARSVRF